MGNICAREEEETHIQDQPKHDSHPIRPAQPTQPTQTAQQPTHQPSQPTQQPSFAAQPAQPAYVPPTNPVHKADPVIPERRAPSPAQVSEPVHTPAPAHQASYVATKDLNPINPIVKKTMESRKARDFRNYPELKDHYATPLDRLKNSANEDTYYGHVVRGVPHGWGTIYTKKGEVLEGVFENGRPVSYLRRVLIDGSDYEGEFKDEKRYGKGTLYRPDGVSIFCQTWVNGVQTGIVEERDQHGRIIFKGIRNEKGLYEGNCTVGFKDYIVEGPFKDGVPAGPCKKSYNDGRVYEGLLSKDFLEQGEGQISFVDGRKFKGPFDKGVANGKGQFTSDTGKTSEQTWRNGKRA